MENQNNGKNDTVVFARDKKFTFSCHRNLDCFNRCCRDINIYLTPYDVLRMKNKLDLDSSAFLEKYTTLTDSGGGLPAVLIKMREDADLACPFLSPEGCSVYDVRGWSCRIAPVDLQENGYSIIFDRSFCRGLGEAKEWTVEEWMENQGLNVYEEKEELLKKIPLSLQLTGMKNLDKHIKDITFMACYDLDRFRRFVLETGFLQIFWVQQDVVDKIRTDDEALLQFGFRWLLNDFEMDQTMELIDELPE